MKFKSLLAILSVFTILFLAACGNNNEQDETADKEKEGSKTEDTGYTVEHAMGTTKLDKTPEKVVILTNEGTEALLSMGVTPVGAVQSWTGDPWYEHIAEDMKDVQVVGTESEVNVEAIAALQPDLIIGNKMRQEKIYDQLNDIAPTVFAETLRGDWKENFELYAKALNKEEEGKKVLADYDSRIQEIKTSLGDKINQEVSIVRFMAGDVRIYHKDTFSGVILDQIGFARPESQNVDDFAEKNATKERIPAMDGDILFYFTYETGDGEASQLEKEWIEDPLFKNLKVSQDGNVHKVNDTIWNTAGGVIAANLLLDDIEEYFSK
ncbi:MULTISPECIES: ABC transporter substrate-binding protein [Cytobacillus]|uniref:Iron-siderophore ABC transporter substrate-binding protein n=1 Tax=Cytobacillus pseudoceanisediminis TaxID=3051614 RepID=A0ABZ2ZFQ8_9BACI|nr:MULTISPECIES: iron-siderophore ABC transporter substrate-binding protein [Cytobacillus]EFV78570.1 Iron(III) dicitrate ABC transporter [Bacillus sp. 2_A_57_CT2]MCS0826281.1 iron-siderophore ABC transporter substrate-binding protein [Cytobacillus firmus]MCM3244378.1 iron-siderophore ABC transporter substrate-binding protein [Cytobacillus oceanisediminis]MCM3402011.1 iron-siderophore ABC transporter substrate-binding protein [Cytobacillus oceanisediminis]MDK7666992.1 iron-siderophore ABC trans